MRTKFDNYNPDNTENLIEVGDNVDHLSKDVQYIERFKQDTRQRKVLVRWMMWVVSIWLAIVLFCTIVGNILCLNMDKQVLITLLATTTINVLGLANIILKGLFGHKSANKKK